MKTAYELNIKEINLKNELSIIYKNYFDLGLILIIVIVY